MLCSFKHLGASLQQHTLIIIVSRSVQVKAGSLTASAGRNFDSRKPFPCWDLVEEVSPDSHRSEETFCFTAWSQFSDSFPSHLQVVGSTPREHQG
ncbi:hypothetical protein RchiOBHm_Chr5g0072561 [Rosa chinensis]|nr:hypothetical protein RchiOBHm_Chr5g0072561 [Rosa chinensis]